MKLKTLLLLTFLLFCSTCYASDSPFNGPYIGFNVNYDKGKTDTTYEAFGGGYDYKINEDGTSFGLFGGWNKTFPNNLLLGAEASYNEVNLEYDNPRQLTDGYPYGPSGPVWPHDVNTYSLERSFAGISKLGFIHQKTLIYGLVGISFGKFTTDLWSELDPMNGSGSETSEYKTGYVVGCGIEQLIYKKMAIRAEYSYSDYEEISTEATGSFSNYKYTFDTKLSSYKVGLSYNF